MGPYVPSLHTRKRSYVNLKFSSSYIHSPSARMREDYCSRPVCVSVCLSVCLSVPALAASASIETSNQQYPLVSLRLFLDLDSWIFEKTSVQKLWREKVRAHRQPLSRSFGTDETQQLRKGQLVGRMLLQRLATGANGVKQARYRRRPTGTRTRMRNTYIHNASVYYVCI